MKPPFQFSDINWRTTVSAGATGLLGFLAFVAALPYELGPVAELFPPAWKPKVALIAAAAAALANWMNGRFARDARAPRRRKTSPKTNPKSKS